MIDEPAHDPERPWIDATLRRFDHARSIDELTAVVVQAAALLLEVATIALYLRFGPGPAAQLAGRHGYSADDVFGFAELHPDDPYPLAEALRTGEAIWLESPDAWAARYPRLTVQARRAQRSWAALPVACGGRAVGAIGLGWADAQTFVAPRRQVALDLAAATARACIDRRLIAPDRANPTV